MNCHRLSNLLSAYIDGELTGVEMIEIRNHLDGCPACQEYLDYLRATKRMVGRLRTAQPAPDFAARIYAGLDQVEPYSLWRRWTAVWNSGFQRLSPAVAVLGVVVFGMLVFMANGINDKFQTRSGAPLTAALPALTSTISMTMAEQPSEPPVMSAVFATRTPGSASGNRTWSIPTSYNQPAAYTEYGGQ
ncbi:MAG: anti-sigma factor [Armatimonadota bacterium]|nr:anti-sigma factor [Armatimonadota bacterium]